MKVGVSEVGSNWFKRQAKQFQDSVLPRSFHLRQNFCLPRACIDVKSMSEKKKMKSYLVECLSTRSTLKKTVQKKSLKKKRWKKPLKKNQFFPWKKTRGWKKKPITQRLKWKNQKNSCFFENNVCCWRMLRFFYNHNMVRNPLFSNYD